MAVSLVVVGELFEWMSFLILIVVSEFGSAGLAMLAIWRRPTSL